MSRHQLSFACECGSTLKASSLDDEWLEDLENIWYMAHRTHEPVECWEASRIRDAEKSRRRYLERSEGKSRG